MKKRKIISMLLLSTLLSENLPLVNAQNIDILDNVNNINLNDSDSNIKDLNVDSSVDDFSDDSEINSNINVGTVLEITLNEDEYVPDLTGNPDGYETIVVKTTGDKKLVKEDYDNLRKSKIPKVDLSQSVSDSIPRGAFANATHLTSFQFPQGIKSIDVGFSTNEGAFYNCKNLKGNLVIPSSVTAIGDNAFYGCSGFTGNLVIPDSVTTIGESAFRDCSGFNGNLVIPNSVTTIGDSAFRNCSGFDGNLVIPNSVTTIGDSAFSGCSGFTGDLIIPDSITSIGVAAFNGCSNFTGNLVIPNSVTAIGDNAFRDCEGFDGNLVIPNSVTTIAYGAFYGCSGFTGELIIPDSVTTIESRAFYGCSGFTGNLVIPDSVTKIEYYAFEGCSGFDGNLVISNSVTTIWDLAFYGCSGFTGELVIPDSVTTIRDRAFYGCSGFTGELVIPDSVTTIESGAFYGCSGFTGDLVIPDSVTTMGNSAFRGCSGFTGNLVIPNSVTAIGDSAFYGCSGFTGELVIPDSVTSIGDFAFSNCSKLTGNLVIPNSVTTIGRYAFKDCSKFTGDLVIPNSVTTIGDFAFYNCSGFTGDLVVPDSVTTIETWAFGACGGFDGNLVIPGSVTTIENYAFYGCSGFTGDLVIPNSVTTIGENAFGFCSGFTGDLVIPDSVTTIGDYAFKDCSGFDGNLVIPNSIISIGKSIVYRNSKIENIYMSTGESDSSTNYRLDIYEELSEYKVIVDLPYDFNAKDTWIESLDSEKIHKPTLSILDEPAADKYSYEAIVNISSPHKAENITILKDNKPYEVPDIDDQGNYIFTEVGDYILKVKTDTGAKSEISFTVKSNITAPTLKYEQDTIDIQSNNSLYPTASIEYRINGGEWVKFEKPFKLTQPVGSIVKVEARVEVEGNYSDVISENLVVNGVVDIPDENLNNALKSILNIDVEDIYWSDLQTIEGDLNLSGGNKAINEKINNLEGLQYLTNVNAIDLSDNKITNISTLKNIENLRNLNLSGNYINLKSAENMEDISALRDANCNVILDNQFVLELEEDTLNVTINEIVQPKVLLNTKMETGEIVNSEIISKEKLIFDIENTDIVDINEDGNLVGNKVGETTISISIKDLEGITLELSVSVNSNISVEESKGSVTIKYLDENGDVVAAEEIKSDIDLGEHTYNAKEIEGYTIVGDSSKTIELTEDNPNQVITFTYKKVEAPVVKGSVTIKYLDESGKALATEEVKSDLELAEYTYNAKDIEGYNVIGDTSKTVELTKENPNQTIEFRYEKVETPSETPVEVKGSVTIRHLDEKGNAVTTEEVKSDLELGSHTYRAKEINGYTVVGDSSKTVELTKDNPNQVITFTYKKVETPAVKGSVTIKYLDESGKALATEEVKSDLELGSHTYKAKEIEGYTIVGDTSKTVELTENNLNQTVEFRYKKVETPSETPVVKGSVTIKHLDEKGNAVTTDEVKSDLELGSHTYKAKEINGYTIVGDTSKTVELTKDNPNQVITFIYKKVVNSDVSDDKDEENEDNKNDNEVDNNTVSASKNDIESALSQNKGIELVGPNGVISIDYDVLKKVNGDLKEVTLTIVDKSSEKENIENLSQKYNLNIVDYFNVCSNLSSLDEEVPVKFGKSIDSAYDNQTLYLYKINTKSRSADIELIGEYDSSVGFASYNLNAQLLDGSDFIISTNKRNIDSNDNTDIDTDVDNNNNNSNNNSNNNNNDNDNDIDVDIDTDNNSNSGNNTNVNNNHNNTNANSNNGNNSDEKIPDTSGANALVLSLSLGSIASAIILFFRKKKNKI